MLVDDQELENPIREGFDTQMIEFMAGGTVSLKKHGLQILVWLAQDSEMAMRVFEQGVLEIAAELVSADPVEVRCFAHRPLVQAVKLGREGEVGMEILRLGILHEARERADEDSGEDVEARYNQISLIPAHFGIGFEMEDS
jgi:hypothetical protein